MRINFPTIVFFVTLTLGLGVLLSGVLATDARAYDLSEITLTLDGTVFNRRTGENVMIDAQVHVVSHTTPRRRSIRAALASNSTTGETTGSLYDMPFVTKAGVEPSPFFTRRFKFNLYSPDPMLPPNPIHAILSLTFDDRGQITDGSISLAP